MLPASSLLQAMHRQACKMRKTCLGLCITVFIGCCVCVLLHTHPPIIEEATRLRLRYHDLHGKAVPLASNDTYCKYAEARHRHEALLTAAERVTSVAEASGVDVWVVAGGLIGYHRHGRYLIPWDNDIDLEVFEEDVPALKNALVRNARARPRRQVRAAKRLARREVLRWGLQHTL